MEENPITESKIEVTWLGHAAFMIVVNGKNLLFDPWIEGNPRSPLGSYRDIKNVDYILVSHDHRDHGLEDGAKISGTTGAAFVGVFELANRAKDLGAAKILPGNIGGIIVHKDMEIFLSSAYHSCDLGVPCGFVVRTGGTTIYHAGDTSLFRDMELIADRWNIDLALLPIGSTYTMDPYDAMRAVKLLNPKKVIPMHYNTFPQVEQDPGKFRELVHATCRNCTVIVMEPGVNVLI